MSLKNKYEVKSIDKSQTYEWLKYKHYSHRIPPIMKSFGLFKNGLLCGVCTFYNGMINIQDTIITNGSNYSHFELNRLCVNDNLDKNVTSYFVGNVLKLMPKPCVLISYADSSQNHHDYIYQATNWIYTGIGSGSTSFKDINTSEIFHEYTIRKVYGTRKTSELPTHIQKEKKGGDKYRYVYFNGSKTFKKKSIKDLKYNILPYPKGENKRYDASYKPTIQTQLF